MPRTKAPASNGHPVTQKGFSAAMKQIDERFERIDERFEKIDQRFEKIDQRFDDMSQEFISLTSYIDKKSEENIEASKREMGVLFEEMIHRLETSLEFANELPPKIENHEARISRIEEEIPILQSALGRAK